jgi:hypothetical protein
MMVKGHLVTCLNLDEVRRFDEQRYVGLGPFYPAHNSTDRKVGARLRILWDVIADLKRVQPNDICFLHAEGLLFGPYVFRSTFKESEHMPQILRSTNLTYENWRTNKALFQNIDTQGEYGYVASIHKPAGCNDTGADLMKIFLHQSLGIFNGIPPRFMYGDTKKIVKPLLYHEIGQSLEILNFNNDWDLLPKVPYPTEMLNDISLDLTSYNGHLYCEKLLEAWFMENMSSTSMQYDEVTNILGQFNYYANSIYTYYTNFLDVMAYNIPENYAQTSCGYCDNVIRNFANDVRLIELKRDHIYAPQAIIQVRGYMNWAKTVLNPNSQITGYIVANGFTNVDNESIKNTDIHLIQYRLNEGELNLEVIF